MSMDAIERFFESGQQCDWGQWCADYKTHHEQFLQPLRWPKILNTDALDFVDSALYFSSHEDFMRAQRQVLLCWIGALASGCEAAIFTLLHHRIPKYWVEDSAVLGLLGGRLNTNLTLLKAAPKSAGLKGIMVKLVANLPGPSVSWALGHWSEPYKITLQLAHKEILESIGPHLVSGQLIEFVKTQVPSSEQFDVFYSAARHCYRTLDTAGAVQILNKITHQLDHKHKRELLLDSALGFCSDSAISFEGWAFELVGVQKVDQLFDLWLLLQGKNFELLKELERFGLTQLDSLNFCTTSKAWGAHRRYEERLCHIEGKMLAGVIALAQGSVSSVEVGLVVAKKGRL